jgi:hypothetical protein
MTSPVPKIIYDLFPAHVSAAPANTIAEPKEFTSLSTLPNTYQIDTARVIVTETHILIAQDTPEGAQVVFNEGYSPENFFRSATPEQDSVVVTLSGKVIAFKKDTNCGCGSRLRSWNPYKTLYSTKG